MKAVVYGDGFSLNHRALKKSGHKWLSLNAWGEASLPAVCDLDTIHSGFANPIASPRGPIAKPVDW